MDNHDFLIELVRLENERALKCYMRAAAKHEAYRKISKQYKDNTEVMRSVTRAYSKEQKALTYLKKVEAAYELVIKVCE